MTSPRHISLRAIRPLLFCLSFAASSLLHAGAALAEPVPCPTGYVRIAPGTFMMGSPTGEEGREADETQHNVTITRAYCMKATEVTQGEWQAMMGSNPSELQGCGANCPVEQVSWDDAVGYANALSRREGLPECYAGSTFTGLGCRGYRLPTEAEWEYAARAGSTGSRFGNLDSVGWYDENSGEATHPVGQKQANAWGLYDMLGNVVEWTGEWYGNYRGTVTDPTGPATGSFRVRRGGSWYAIASDARAAFRFFCPPDSRDSSLGFRLVRTAFVVSEPGTSVRVGPAAGASSTAPKPADCPAGYVRVSPGTFTMGSPNSEDGRYDNESQHSVTITRGYCMKATEVTQGEWQAVMGSNPSKFTNCGANCPVEQVSWEDAVGYANALGRQEGLPECYAGSTFTGLGCRGYRLPTEAEWEYAARAGTTGATYGGNLTIRGERNGPALDPIAWYGGNAGVSYDGAFDCSDLAEKQFPSESCGTHPVGQKQPNAWGLYDMLGSVWEWTGDPYDTYPGTVTDPTGPATGSSRVSRGGSWSGFARYARAAFRDYDAPDLRYRNLGFRLSRTEP